MRSKTLLNLILLFLFPIALFATPGTELTQMLKNVNSMQANFTQRNYSGKGRLLSVHSGNMAMSRPGRFRWNITSPSQQLMVADGKNLWIYDKSLKQVTVQKQNRGISRTPASLLSGSVNLLTNYFTVQFYKGSYYLRPRYSGSMIKMVRMKFNGNKLIQMQLYDKLGQRSDLSFSNVRVNRSISSATFRFNAPRGVDIIRSGS